MSQRRLPAAIYWRRRLLLVALVILIAWVVLQLVGGDDDTPSADPTPSPSVPSPAATTPAVTTPTPEPTPEYDGVVQVSLSSAATPCDPEKIRITPTVRPGQLVRAPVAIGLVVSSTQEAACTLRPADAALLAVISANGTAIWDSTVCKTSLLTEPVAVSPQWATLVGVTWTGRGSGANCNPKEGFATPGSYTIQAGTFGGEPGKVRFSLSAAPKPPPAAKTPKAPTPKTATPKPPATQKTTAAPND